MNSEDLFPQSPWHHRLAWPLSRRQADDEAAPAGPGWDLAHVWVGGIRFVLSLLLLTILAALLVGVGKTFLDIRLLFTGLLEESLRQIIVDTLILLAVVEVFRTTVAYFTEGRVKVTFIVDTILVVMLTEVISQWFKGGALAQLALLGAILLILGAMRILAVRWSPTPAGENVTRA